MFEPRSAAAAYGITIELTDLGTWGPAMLVSEYDHRAGAIRVNARALEDYRRACGELEPREVRAFIALAVAHELYHHREATGEVPRLRSHREREAAANAFARANVLVDARLDAYVRSKAAW